MRRRTARRARTRIASLWRWSFWLFCSAALFSPLPSSAGSHDKHGLDFTGYDAAIEKGWRKYNADFPDWRWWKAQIYQESAFDTHAVSGVGARGLCQAMPGTFANWSKELKWGDASPHVAKFCIDGGAYYMAQFRRFPDWRSWPDPDRHRMAQASYNAGAGWIMKARARCAARTWAATAPCLASFTGRANARQTTDYVRLIARWRTMMMDP
jgi:membrane-bound lytic murein transglycosylase F